VLLTGLRALRDKNKVKIWKNVSHALELYINYNANPPLSMCYLGFLSARSLINASFKDERKKSCVSHELLPLPLVLIVRGVEFIHAPFIQ